MGQWPGLRSRRKNVRLLDSKNFTTFPKFPTPTPTASHNVKEVWLSTILQQQVINGNRSAQQELSVSIKGSKEIVPFQQVRVRIPNLEFDVKNNSRGLPHCIKNFDSDSYSS